VLDEEVEHGHRADGGGAVQRVLAALVAHPRRGRLCAAALEQLAGEVEVGFGGDEVEGCLLWREVGVSISGKERLLE
jgi:hypothetical protein